MIFTKKGHRFALQSTSVQRGSIKTLLKRTPSSFTESKLRWPHANSLRTSLSGRMFRRPSSTSSGVARSNCTASTASSKGSFVYRLFRPKPSNDDFEDHNVEAFVDPTTRNSRLLEAQGKSMQKLLQAANSRDPDDPWLVCCQVFLSSAFVHITFAR